MGDKEFREKLSQNLECPEDRAMQSGYNRLSISREKSGILEEILSGLN